jgi:hypothetical protein
VAVVRRVFLSLVIDDNVENNTSAACYHARKNVFVCDREDVLEARTRFCTRQDVLLYDAQHGVI